MNEREGVSVRENIAALVFLLAAVACLVITLMAPLLDINVLDHPAVARRMLLTGITALLFGVFVGLGEFCYKRRFRPLWLRIVLGLVCGLIAALVGVTQYVSPLPQLTQLEAPSPLRDIRAAVQILHDDSEPVTVSGVFEHHTYRMRVSTGKNGGYFNVDRYTLEDESGLEILTNHCAHGIYTVTYSPVTRLAYTVSPYDPNCGENVLEWNLDSRQYSDWEQWKDKIPEMHGVTCVKLERPFPKLLLRITHGGEVTDEKYFDSDAERISLVHIGAEPGTYTAQLYAVMRYGVEETLIPISNAAVLTLE